MNTKKNQGGYQNNGAGSSANYSGYAGHQGNGNGGAGAGYSTAVQSAKNGGGQHSYSSGGVVAGSASGSSMGSRSSRGSHSSYNSNNNGMQPSQAHMHQPQSFYNSQSGYHTSNGPGGGQQQGYSDRGGAGGNKGSYAASASSSAISNLQSNSSSNMAYGHNASNPHYHGSNGHHGSHYQSLHTSHSFHSNGGGGGAGPMGAHNKYAPHQSVGGGGSGGYETKTSSREKAPPTSTASSAAVAAVPPPPAQVQDPKAASLAQPSETQSRILPSPSNSAVNRTGAPADVPIKSEPPAAPVPSRQTSKTVATDAAGPRAPAETPVASSTSSVSPKTTTTTTTTTSTAPVATTVAAPAAITNGANGPVRTEEAKDTPPAVDSNPSKTSPSVQQPVAVSTVSPPTERSSESATPPSPATPRLADLVKSRQSYEDKAEYCRDLVTAIDRLYPNDKWPLHNTWTFWFIKHDSTQNWLDNVKRVADVEYVEDFWSVFRNMVTPSKLSNTTQGDLAFFKKGIQPTWEDPGNKSGGSWLHQISVQQFNKKSHEIDELWKESMLALIGDNFCGRNSFGLPLEEGEETADDHICDNISGIFVAQRGKHYKLTLWTKNFKDEKTTRLIGRIWKQLLKMSETITITFEAHETKYSKTANFKIVYKE